MQEGQGAGDAAEDTDTLAKSWKHLYDADYELLFNPKLFPVEMLQGKEIGDYMTSKFDLFDHDL